MDADCLTLAGSFPAAQSKTSNSLFLLPGCDGRSSQARRFRDLIRGLLRDLGLTEGDLSNSTKLQVRHAAMLAVRVEQGQERATRGDDVDMLALIRAQNSLSRALWGLGLAKRRRSTLTPENVPQVAGLKVEAKPAPQPKPPRLGRRSTETAAVVHSYLSKGDEK